MTIMRLIFESIDSTSFYKHYSFCVRECNFKRFSGENVLVYSSNMKFVNKDNVYLNICISVFGDTSFRASAAA